VRWPDLAVLSHGRDEEPFQRSALPLNVDPPKEPHVYLRPISFSLLIGVVALRSRRGRVVLTGHHTRREAGGHV
jgi:hypothetical protein